MATDGDQKAANAAATGPARQVLLTGGNSGIGLQAAMQLLAAGHRLTVPCRDAASADRLGQVLAPLAEQPPAEQPLGGRLATPICDLGDLASVERCAADLLTTGEPIDSLVLNAGLQYSGASEPRWSVQGFELTVAVNHLAHQALLQRLLPLLLRGTAPRLVGSPARRCMTPPQPAARWGNLLGWVSWPVCARAPARRCSMAVCSMPRGPTRTASSAIC
jgi:protochlorophyllide reductase